jgi:hypothetical protein
MLFPKRRDDVAWLSACRTRRGGATTSRARPRSCPTGRGRGNGRSPERRNPRESPAHLLLVVLEVLQRGDRLTNEGNVAAVQVGDDTVEMIGDQGASGASPALVGEPESIAKHEVIDEELRAPSEEVRQRGAAYGNIGLSGVCELHNLLS